MAFVDEVLARRRAAEQVTDRAAAEMSKELDRIRREVLDALDKLKDYTDENGKFVDNSAARARLKQTLADVESAVEQGIADLKGTLREAKDNAFGRAYFDTAHAVEEATGKKLEVGISFSQIFKEAARESATSELLGVKPDAAFKGVEAWTKDKLKDTITNAVLNGESIDKTAKKITDATDITKRSATRIVRTNINAAVNDAHKAVIDKNDDIFDGYVWDATMDARTSSICATLHGTFYPFGTEPPGPPAHPNCRSVLVGHFKDPEMEAAAEEGDRRVRDIPEDPDEYGKTSLIPQKTTFEEWLKRQPPEGSREITGSVVKDRLWRTGNLPFKDLLKPDLTKRTDEEAIQLANALHPKSDFVHDLMDAKGVEAKTLAAIRKADKALADAQEFDQGKPPPTTPTVEKPPEPAVPETPTVPGVVDPAASAGSIRQKLLDSYEKSREEMHKKLTALYDKQDTLAREMNKRSRAPTEAERAAQIEVGVELRRMSNEYNKIYETTSAAFIESFRRPAGEHMTVAVAGFGSDTTETHEQMASKAFNEVSQFLTKDYGSVAKVNFRTSADRAFFDDTKNLISGRPEETYILYHEFGHKLEDKDYRVREAAQKFLASRTKGETASKLKELTGDSRYDDDEIAKPDKFMRAYVGKIYADGSTEITSMGVEHFFRDPMLFAKADPGHFEYTVAILQGRPPQ